MIDDGGPAFPRASGPEPWVNGSTDFCDGMSLLDYFAAIAWDWAVEESRDMTSNDEPARLGRAARLAYDAAEALLIERERRTAEDDGWDHSPPPKRKV